MNPPGPSLRTELASDDRSATPAVPIRRAFLHGAAWLTGGVLISRLLTLGVLIGSARLLGQSAFGQLCLVQQTVALIATVSGYGLSMTAATQIAELRESDRVRAGRVLSLMVAGSLGLAMLSALLVGLASGTSALSLVAPELNHLPLIPFLLWLASAGLCLNLQACLAGLSGFRQATYVQLIDAGGGCVLVPLGVLYGGLNGAILAFSLSSLFACAMAGRFLIQCAAGQSLALKLPGRLDVVREGGALVRYGLPVMLAGQVWALANWICPVMLVRSPGGFAELAIFNAASYWFNALILVPTILQRVGTVLHSGAVGRQNAGEGRAVYRDAVIFNAAVIGVCALPLAALSPQILSLFGPEFRRGWPTMLACLLTALCVALVKPAEQSLFATGRTWTIFGLCGVFAAGLVAFGAAWAALGAFGIASSRLAVYVLHAGLMTWAARAANRAPSEPCFPEAVPLRQAA